MTKKTSKPSEDKKKLKELTETLQRLQAEFENYKKRVEREREQYAKFATEDILKKLLPLIDNLEIALKHTTQQDEFYKGIELIFASFRELLAAEDVKPLPCIGLPFDPFRHEAMFTKASNQPKDTIIEELQKGYTYHDHVLRTAKVVLSSGKSEVHTHE